MRNQRGTTLVELLIYIGIVGLILTTIASFLLNMLIARVKTQTISEMVTHARVIQDRLHDAARHAEGINVGTSTFEVDPGVLSFDMVDVSRDPAIFSLSADDGVFQVSEAGGAATSLTPTHLAVTNLVFTNLTSAEELGIIQVQFTLESISDSGVQLFEYAEEFQTTLRIPLDD